MRARAIAKTAKINTRSLRLILHSAIIMRAPTKGAGVTEVVLGREADKKTTRETR